MSKDEKIDRKALKRPDEFMSRGQQFMLWMSKRRKRFVPVFIAGVVLVITVYAFDWYSTRQLNEAWAQYYKINKSTGEGKWEELKTFQKERGSFRPGYFAALELGDHHFEQARKAAFDGETGKVSQEANQAIEWYTRALDFGELLPSERQLVYINRGNSHEIKKDFPQAMADYGMAVEFGGDPEALALLSLGRVQGLEGKADLARGTYERLTKEFINTEYAKLARNHLRRLDSPLFTEKK